MKFIKKGSDAVLIISLILSVLIVACSPQIIEQTSAPAPQAAPQPEAKAPVNDVPAEEKSTKTKQDIFTEKVKSKGSQIQDNVAPTIKLTEPDSGEKIQSDIFVIWWTAKDDNQDELLITLEYKKSGDWVLLGDNLINDRTFEWNLGNLENGAYQIRASATDGQKTASTVRPFTIERN